MCVFEKITIIIKYLEKAQSKAEWNNDSELEKPYTFLCRSVTNEVKICADFFLNQLLFYAYTSHMKGLLQNSYRIKDKQCCMIRNESTSMIHPYQANSL